VYVEAGEVLRCAAPETLTRPRPPSPSSCDDRDGRAICVPPSWPLMPANGVGGPRSTMVRARAEPGPATCLSSAASGHLFPQDPTTPATSHAVPWNPRCWERPAVFCASLAADVVHQLVHVMGWLTFRCRMLRACPVPPRLCSPSLSVERGCWCWQTEHRYFMQEGAKRSC